MNWKHFFFHMDWDWNLHFFTNLSSLVFVLMASTILLSVFEPTNRQEAIAGLFMMGAAIFLAGRYIVRLAKLLFEGVKEDIDNARIQKDA